MTTRAKFTMPPRAHWAALFVVALITLGALSEWLVGSRPILISAQNEIHLLPNTQTLRSALSSPNAIQWALWPVIQTRSTLDLSQEGWRAACEIWLYATRWVVAASLVVASFASVLGLALGWVATLAPRICDFVLRHAVALSGSLPSLALVGVVRVSGLLPAPIDIALVLVLLRSIEAAHLVRTLIISLQERDFVTAARATGGSRLHVLRWHLLPHLKRPLASFAATTLAHVVALEAGLNLVGLTAAGSASWASGLMERGFSLNTLLALGSLVSATLASIALARQAQRDRWVERHYV